MRIHSKFHDYYDLALKFGADSTIHYLRKQSEIEYKLPFPFPQEIVKMNRKWNDDKIIYYYIGFCGKVFLVKETESKIELPKRDWSVEYETKFTFSFELIEGDFTKLFIEFDCPIFLYYMHRWENKTFVVKNCCLKQHGFFKVKTPFEAFQEISQFLTNELAKEIVVEKPSDKTLIQSHGFNKQSFRSELPPKRKRK